MSDHPESVPCGLCNECCRFDGSMVKRPILRNIEQQYASVKDANSVRRIACKDNGDCVYLDRRTGCMIHNARPQACRAWDCRADGLRAQDDVILAEYLGPAIIKAAKKLRRKMRT